MKFFHRIYNAMAHIFGLVGSTFLYGLFRRQFMSSFSLFFYKDYLDTNLCFLFHSSLFLYMFFILFIHGTHSCDGRHLVTSGRAREEDLFL